MADEELTEQEKMDRMVAELSEDIEDINKEGKGDEPEPEKTSVAEEEAKDGGPKEPEGEGEADEELTEQEKMDSMVAELSEDIENINKEGKEDEPEPEKTPAVKEETKEEEPKEPESDVEGVDEELKEPEKMDEMVAELSEEDIEEIEKGEGGGQERSEKDLEETVPERKATPDKPSPGEERDEVRTGEMGAEPDLYQEGSDANDESDKNIDGWEEYPDIAENGRRGRGRGKAIMWSVIAIMVLGLACVWFVYDKDINILKHPILAQWIQKLNPKPAVKDAGHSDPPLPKSPATESQVKAPQATASSPQAEAKPDPLTKSEMFQQKMQQILVVRDKLSEKRAQAASIREKLNEQILALKLEVLAKQRVMGITSYEEAIKSPRIDYNIKLIQQLKAYASKLAERIRYYEDGYAKMRFRYQETEDNFKIIELWSDTKTKRLMAKIDKAMNEYPAANKPHMFTNKQIVLDKPLKIWTEVIQTTGKSNHL